MENKFKCKDEVVFRSAWDEKARWTYGIVSHTLNDAVILSGNIELHESYYNVLPYEGNERLVGTTNEPKEEIILNVGDLVYGFNCLEDFEKHSIRLGEFDRIDYRGFVISSYLWGYCIPYSKYNINDMESAKREILKVENGKIVKMNLE